ncbi:M43 family zinc metalloprotease [Flavobacterium sp.]|uniref:M43 family zinc metalloprotease n=1 Tax=Flavobacterium sp. TaxID=239 RepID=UPI003D1307B6
MKLKKTILAFSLLLIISCQKEDELSPLTPQEGTLIQNTNCTEKVNKQTSTDLADATFDINKQKPITLPVYFHILYSGKTPTVTAKDIELQMTELNKCFSGKATGAAKLANVRFENVRSKDTKIRFILEGIRFKKTNSNVWSGLKIFKKYSDAKNESEGGSRPYSPEKTINVWVLEGMILDKTYNPNDKAFTLGKSSSPFDAENLDYDGILLSNLGLPNAQEKTRTFINPFTNEKKTISARLGRALPHEVGHYLGLDHLLGPLDIPCGDDDIEDTPPAQKLHSGKPLLPFTEKCDGKANFQMFMNMMDYTDDEIRYMFTKGQVNEMWKLCFYGTDAKRKKMIE